MEKLSTDFLEVRADKNIGIGRDNQEDAFLVAEKDGGVLLAVADGMGGETAGDVASRMAIQALDVLSPEESYEEDDIRELIEQINRAIHRESVERGAQMGTTLTLLWITPKNAWYGHVGDSRLSRLRDGALEQITDDHNIPGSLFRDGEINREEARVHPMGRMLLRFLGDKNVKVDTGCLELQSGDLFVLSTDGLHDSFPLERFEEILKQPLPIDDTVNELIRSALDEDNQDNLTAVLVKIA